MQNPSKSAKKIIQGIIFAIISCQRLMCGHSHLKSARLKVTELRGEILKAHPNSCHPGRPEEVSTGNSEEIDRILAPASSKFCSGVAPQTKPKKGPKRKVHEFHPFLGKNKHDSHRTFVPVCPQLAWLGGVRINRSFF